MRTADSTAWRAPSSARWMALVGAACALLLAVVGGVYSVEVGALEHADARWASPARASEGRSALSAPLHGQRRLVGVHAPPAHGQLELQRPGAKPPPYHQRPEARPGLAIHANTRLAERTRKSLSYVPPTSPHGRVADRPVVANCPAQGPPRTA